MSQRSVAVKEVSGVTTIANAAVPLDRDAEDPGWRSAEVQGQNRLVRSDTEVIRRVPGAPAECRHPDSARVWQCRLAETGHIGDRMGVYRRAEPTSKWSVGSLQRLHRPGETIGSGQRLGDDGRAFLARETGFGRTPRTRGGVAPGHDAGGVAHRPDPMEQHRQPLHRPV